MIKELRIGNYLKAPLGELSRVKYLGDVKNPNYIGYELINGKGEVTGFGQNAGEPIPLTTEVIEAIDWGGYTNLSINSYFKIDYVGHVFYCGDYTGLNVWYLHELQNLKFALTGTELEIDITKL